MSAARIKIGTIAKVVREKETGWGDPEAVAASAQGQNGDILLVKHGNKYHLFVDGVEDQHFAPQNEVKKGIKQAKRYVSERLKGSTGLKGYKILDNSRQVFETDRPRTVEHVPNGPQPSRGQ